jgi:hypothetical protein
MIGAVHANEITRMPIPRCDHFDLMSRYNFHVFPFSGVLNLEWVLSKTYLVLVKIYNRHIPLQWGARPMDACSFVG